MSFVKKSMNEVITIFFKVVISSSKIMALWHRNLMDFDDFQVFDEILTTSNYTKSSIFHQNVAKSSNFHQNVKVVNFHQKMLALSEII